MITWREYYCIQLLLGGGGGLLWKFYDEGCAGRTLKTPPIHIKAKPEMLKGGGGGLLRKFYDGGVPIGTPRPILRIRTDLDCSRQFRLGFVRAEP